MEPGTLREQSALEARTGTPPWILLWILAFAIYFACKWITWRRARLAGIRGTPLRRLGYLLAWPGMDARAFLDPRIIPSRPRGGEWLFAAAKTAFGAGIFWLAAPAVARECPFLAAWTGLLGLISLLHFGSFHLLSLLWRRAGVEARPIMKAPILACSLGDFWSRRWNVAFHQLALDLVARPAKRWAGARGALLLAFLASGFVHDLVISLPARGGYGLPTGYFLLQGAGILAERSLVGKRIGLGNGFRGWIFTALVTTAPAYYLFHPRFIGEVAVPFFRAVGAG